MEHDIIIRRIRKLLALSRDEGAEEATSAVLMAHRLIAKYGISDSVLNEDEEDKDERIVGIGTEPLVTARGWRWDLAFLIADNFRCKFYESYETVYSNRLDRRVVRKKLIFYGYDSDAEAASLAFTYLYRTGNRLANATVRRMKSKHGAFNSYITGFLFGIRLELEKQSKELMVVLSHTVMDKYESEVAPGIRWVTGRELSCDYRRKSLIEKGKQDGADSVRHRRLRGCP
ncbi:DUF2786 domain-containing protein [Enterococcus faecalis]|nr:DUF2786 domain-containing protein [Enterococcus faecalis]